MPFVDRIIQYLQAQQGERIVIESDQNCVVYRSGGTSAPTRERLTQTQITGMLNEIMPDDCRLQFSSGQSFVFPYAWSGGTMQVEVHQEAGALRVSIGLPHVPEEAAAAAAVPRPDPRPAAPAYTGPLKKIAQLDDMFRLLQELEGSDLHMSCRRKPMVRIHGTLKTLEEYEVNEPARVKELIWQVMPQRNQEEWERDRDTDFAYELKDVARFRCNAFEDRFGPGAVFRLIPSRITTAEELKLSKAMLDLCFLSKGLVIVTGPSGCGKSTTLAALVDYVNKHRRDHIITIEDPIEFVHSNINCLINQRQVHVHTQGFARALRAALREDPDIVLVGEMRDLETVAIAIETAETGHLVFATLHTSTAATTVDRVIDQFPPDQQEQIRTMLSETLKAVIAQTLLRTKEGRRIAAFETLLIDPACSNLIREGKTYQLNSMMQIGRGRGCVPMNESIFEHVKAGRVDPMEAYVKAVDKVSLLAHFEKEGIRLDLPQLQAA